MDPFETAVDLVQKALSALEMRGVQLSASPDAMVRLLACRTAPAPKGASSGVPPVEKPALLVPSPDDQPRPIAALPAAQPATPRRVVPILPFAPKPVVAEPIPMPATGTKAERLAAMRGPVLSCLKCPILVASRTQVVFGIGNPEAELMFVGEAPGADEDRTGEPFVGLAGQLLTRMIEAMGFTRNDVYIANVLKCRPNMPPASPGNRKPTTSEMQTCLPYLEQQISTIQPRIIVALGATAMQGLLGETAPMGRLRGRWHDLKGTPLMATFHPSYLLRDQSLGEKRKVWEDMLLVLERLGREITAKQRGYFLQKA